MGLDPKAVKASIKRGLAPINQLVSQSGDVEIAKVWRGFLKGETRKLLTGEITIDEWKAALGEITAGVAQSADPQVASLFVQGAEQATRTAEEAFNPPSPMRWLLFGGVAATAIAYWWMKKEEKQRARILVATPQIIAGSPRKKRPAIEVEQVEDAEFEEI